MLELLPEESTWNDVKTLQQKELVSKDHQLNAVQAHTILEHVELTLRELTWKAKQFAKTTLNEEKRK